MFGSKKRYFGVILLFALLFAGCRAEKSDSESDYWIYHVNYKKNGLEKTEYSSKDEKLDVGQVAAWLSGEGETEISILPGGVELIGYSQIGDVLNLNFNSNYRKIDVEDEILCRVAIVKNFVQVPGIHYVQFYIEEEDLLDNAGNVIGLLNNSSFVEFSGENLGDIQSKKLVLYFADEDGDHLEMETRTVYYSSSAPIEKVIVEQLIQGPQKNSHYATIPSGTGIIGVSIANNVVYVNLDQKVLNDGIAAKPEVSVYSIVNSVLAVGNAAQVQISINGDSKTVFKDSVDLNQTFEFNSLLLEDHVEQEPEVSKEAADE